MLGSEWVKVLAPKWECELCEVNLGTEDLDSDVADNGDIPWLLVFIEFPVNVSCSPEKSACAEELAPRSTDVGKLFWLLSNVGWLRSSSCFIGMVPSLLLSPESSSTCADDDFL